jgi:ABC-type branched-subunit amino acid transport system substrate-binding protein
MIVNTVLPSDPTWVFSVLPLVDHIVQAEMGFASKDLKASKIALFYSQTPYGQQASKIVANTAKSAYGLDVVLNIGVEANATDVSPLLARVRDAKADALLTVLTGPLQIVLAKNAASLGLTMPVLLAIDDPSVLKQAAAAYGPVYLNVSAPMAWPDQIADPKRKAAVKDFMSEWKAAGHTDLTGGIFALYGWDEVQLLVSAIKASHATTGDGLRNALEKATLVGTTTDYIYSASDHTGQQNVPIPVAIGQYKAGNLVLVSPFPK